MSISSGTPTAIAIILPLFVLVFCVVILAALFVAFIHWTDRVQTADSFAVDFVAENVDVTAIEDEHLADMPRRPKALGRKGWRP